jgi:hypothetical protein
MAIQINGNGTITGISSGGLPAGSVTSATLATGAVSASMPTNSVLQTVYASTPDSPYYSSSNSWTNYLSASITPTSSSNKILIYHVVTYGGDDNSYAAGRIYRSGSGTTNTHVATPTNYQFTENRFTDSTFPLFMNGSANDPYKMYTNTIVVEDTPASTAAVTYTCAAKADAAARTVWINRSTNNPTDGYNPRPVTTITLMEIKA